MSSSKLTVIVLVAMGVLVVVGLWFYLDEHGAQQKLSDIDCGTILPTTFELQGDRIDVSREGTCDVISLVAGLQPLKEDSTSAADAWHYFGRMRIRPKNDVWFLVFMAHPADGYHLTFSLRHRRGNGWAVVGRFDAAPILQKLGLEERIDMEKLKSAAALTPVDQMTPM